MSTTCTDFVTIGQCEFQTGSSASIDAIRNSLLPNQPRRCLLKPVLLTSDHAKASGFVTPSGLCSAASIAVTSDNTCTDFILWGEAAEGTSGFGISTVRRALLPANANCSPVCLSSCHSTTHFTTGGLCSAPFTNQDVVWMEKVAQLPKGMLFQAFLRDERPSPSELPWEPLSRYQALSKTLRTPKGGKSLEHLQVLRHSDPLTRLEGWLDWDAISTRCEETRPYKIHQQALIDRALHAHRRLTAEQAALAQQQQESIATALEADQLSRNLASNGLKRAMHLGRLQMVEEEVASERSPVSDDQSTAATGRLKSVDEVGFHRDERRSNDSVIDFFGGHTPPGSPAPTAPLPGPPVLGKARPTAPDPSSPNSIMGTAGLDDAIRDYKLAGNTPGLTEA